MAKFCGQCGSLLNDTALFCGGCGTKVPVAAAPPVVAPAPFTQLPPATPAPPPAAYTPVASAYTPVDSSLTAVIALRGRDRRVCPAGLRPDPAATRNATAIRAARGLRACSWFRPGSRRLHPPAPNYTPSTPPPSAQPADFAPVPGFAPVPAAYTPPAPSYTPSTPPPSARPRTSRLFLVSPQFPLPTLHRHRATPLQRPHRRARRLRARSGLHANPSRLHSSGIQLYAARRKLRTGPGRLYARDCLPCKKVQHPDQSADRCCADHFCRRSSGRRWTLVRGAKDQGESG